MQESAILSILCVLARVSAFIAFVPLFARRQLPVAIKAGLAMALTIFWWDSAPHVAGSVSLLGAVLTIAREIGIGLLLSLLVGLLLVPARIAGSYVGQEIGISMDPVTNAGLEQSTIIAMLFETFAVLIFFGLNLHQFLIIFVHYSFAALNGIQITDLPTEGLVGLISRLPEYGLLIVAPVGITSFVILVGLFLLSKAAPTMNLFSVGMPLRVGIGILCLSLFLPVLWKSIETYFYLMLEDLERFMGYF